MTTSAAPLLCGLLFGCIGVAMSFHGRKHRLFMPSLCGALLVVYPFLVTRTVWLVLVGVLLSILPYFVRV